MKICTPLVIVRNIWQKLNNIENRKVLIVIDFWLMTRFGESRIDEI
jgi:hypothetical protein